MGDADDFDRRAWFYDLLPVPTHARRLAKRLGPVTGTVVDLGGGTAKYTVRVFDPKRTRIVVVDVARRMLQRGLRKRRPVHAVQASAALLPVRDRSVSVVLCTEAFHHFVDLQEQVVREAARVLRPDGVFLIEEPDPERFPGMLMAWGERQHGMSSLFRAPGTIAALVGAHFHDVTSARSGRFTYIVDARRPREAPPQPL